MKMKAIDTLHISAVGPHSIQPGETFEVSDPDGKDLEKRGLAKPVAAPVAKAEAPLQDKAEIAPVSKATVKPAPKNGK